MFFISKRRLIPRTWLFDDNTKYETEELWCHVQSRDISVKSGLWEVEHRKLSDYVWTLVDTQIHSSEETTHLGLKPTESGECEVNVNNRIKSARRTKYPLMNSGYHGTNEPRREKTCFRGF